MYSIIETGGFQYKIHKNDRVRIPLIQDDVGSEVELQNMLYFSDDENVTIGTPYIKDAIVKAEVLRHAKDKKIIVFKKKRRKKFRKKQGHRQNFTEIRIKDIIMGASNGT